MCFKSQPASVGCWSWWCICASLLTAANVWYLVFPSSPKRNTGHHCTIYAEISASLSQTALKDARSLQTLSMTTSHPCVSGTRPLAEVRLYKPQAILYSFFL